MRLKKPLKKYFQNITGYSLYNELKKPKNERKSVGSLALWTIPLLFRVVTYPASGYIYYETGKWKPWEQIEYLMEQYTKKDNLENTAICPSSLEKKTNEHQNSED